MFVVAQGSFLITTFKYLCVILLSSINGISEDTHTTLASESVVGAVLMVLDVFFLVASFLGMFAILVLLRAALTLDKKKKEGVRTGSSNNSQVQVVPQMSLSSRWQSFNHVKAIEHAKVEKTEKESERAHIAAMKVVEQNQAASHLRLMGRIQKRKSSMGVGLKKVVEGVVKETDVPKVVVVGGGAKRTDVPIVAKDAAGKKSKSPPKPPPPKPPPKPKPSPK